MRFHLNRRAWALVLWVMPAVAVGAQLPSRFTLGNYIPDRAWFLIHVVENPERAWIEQEWAEVIEAFKSSGIDRDIANLFYSLMSDDEKTKAQATVDKITNLIRGVRWGDLVKREFAFAEGTPTQGGYGYILLTRGAEGSGAANAAGLVAILKEVTTLSSKVSLVESKVHDIDVWTLGFGSTPEGPAVALDLFRKDDVIGMAFDLPMGKLAKSSRQTFEDVTALMAGKSTKKSIVAGARFQEAIAQVKPPQDAVSFFDVKSFLGDLDSLFKRVGEHVAASQGHEPVKNGEAKSTEKSAEVPACAGENDDVKAMAILTKVVSLADFLDYNITTVSTQGRRELTHSATRIQAGKENSPIASAFVVRKSFDRFDQFVPADATGFQLSGFVDLGAIYTLAMDFIAKDVPNGENIVAQIKGAMAQVGFDPQRDVFDWWSGEMINIELPAAVVTPMGGADSVTMIRVKNPQLAAQKINTALDFLSSKMQSQGQMLMIAPAKVNADGFREVTHPMFAMIARPVIGVYGDWLMIGTSAGAVNKCLDVAAGKSPSIKENKRYIAEGLIPKGPVQSASFQDTSNYGQELAGAIGMAGFVGGMVVASMPDHDAESKKAKKAIQSAMSIVMKLGPVLQKIDFYSSESSLTTYDGKLTLLTESVITYKEPGANQPGHAQKP